MSDSDNAKFRHCLIVHQIQWVSPLTEGAGKPLPDKYRFLLFENKREVELVWNGKTKRYL